MKKLLIVLLLFQASFAVAQTCSKISSQHRNTLVELFTSDGCNSCPPANQWLSALVKNNNPAVIPLSLHVTYWNHLGWVDRFSDRIFDQRQELYARTAVNKFSYTPEIFAGGKEWRSWRSPADLSDLVAKNSKSVAPLQIGITAQRSEPSDQWTVTIDLDPVAGYTSSGQLFLALYEDDLSTNVKSGENSGSVLRHDHVVRKWVGPLEFSGTSLRRKQTFVLEKQWNPRRMGVVAIVQAANREVLQTLSLPLCVA